jgi:hypothetical protein
VIDLSLALLAFASLLTGWIVENQIRIARLRRGRRRGRTSEQPGSCRSNGGRS